MSDLGSIIAVIVLVHVFSVPPLARPGDPGDRPAWADIRVELAEDFTSVEVVGLNPEILACSEIALLGTKEWREILPIFTGDSDLEEGKTGYSMLGRYQLTGDRIRFVPRFPFSAGLTYVVEFDPGRLLQELDLEPGSEHPQRLRASFAIPQPAQVPVTQIEQVYPTADILPVNLLKFYVSFSAPMRSGHAHDHIRLYDETAGKFTEDAFLVLDKELWDPEQRRLTVLLDPGRIKRGISPNLMLGMPLVEGRSYRLLIDKSWKDSNGSILVGDFTKHFRVKAADRRSPHVDRWQIIAPKGRTKEPLTIRFKESLDYGLLNRLITILDQNKNEVTGIVAISRNETEWSLAPTASWRPGVYSIKVDTWLEDLAGNNLRRVFDVDLKDPNYRTNDRNFMTLNFAVE